MIPLIVISFSVFWLLLGYQIGRHRKYDEAFREGQIDAFDRGQRMVQHMREHQALGDQDNSSTPKMTPEQSNQYGTSQYD